MTVALTSVCAFVDLEVFATCKHFAAAGKQTRKRFLAGVDADVVDKLVLGLERAQTTTAVQPQTDVDALVRRADVLQADVGDEVVHRVEGPTAARPVAHPPTNLLLFDGRRRLKVAEQPASPGARRVTAGTDRRVTLRHHGPRSAAVVEGERIDRK